MAIKLTIDETEKERILNWSCDSMKDTVPNRNGITHEHVSEGLEGACEFRFGDKTIVLKAGQSIVLPLNTPYDVVVTAGPASMRCIYSKDTGAAESVAGIAATVESAGGELDFLIHADEARTIPKSDTVVDYKGDPVPKDPPPPPADDGGGVVVADDPIVTP